MKNKNYDVDTILKESLGGFEEPSPELVYKLKRENYTMNKKRFARPSMAVAVALIVILSFSAVAFAAAPMIWRYLDTEIIQGNEFLNQFSVKVSEDGTTSIITTEIDSGALEDAGGGAIIVEVDGETRVLLDNLHFDNIEDAVNTSRLDNFLMPGFIPYGFIFERATLPINPINHPEEFMAGIHIVVDYTKGEEHIRIQAMQWDSEFGGIGIFSENQVEVTINGNVGALADGMLSVIIDDVLYSISTSEHSTVTKEELIKIAESLQ